MMMRSLLLVALALHPLAATAPAQQPAVGGAVPRAGQEPEQRPVEPQPTTTTEEARREHEAEQGQDPESKANADATDQGRPRTRLQLALGGGRFEHDTTGAPTLQDDTGGGYARLGFEHIGRNDWGVGIMIEGASSKDDLFGSSSVTGLQAKDTEVYLHATRALGTDAVRVPLRFGFSFRDYTLADATGPDLSWSSIGPRVEVEPDFRLHATESTRWSLYGRLGLFFGYTEIETDPATDTWTTAMTGVDFGLGTRFAFEHVEFGVGYFLRSHHARQSDVENGVFLREFDARVDGIEFSLAVLF